RWHRSRKETITETTYRRKHGCVYDRRNGQCSHPDRKCGDFLSEVQQRLGSRYRISHHDTHLRTTRSHCLRRDITLLRHRLLHHRNVSRPSDHGRITWNKSKQDPQAGYHASYQRLPDYASGASRFRSAAPVGLQPSTSQPDDRVTHDTFDNIHREEGPHGTVG